MRAGKVIHVVGAHAEGEAGDVIVGGVAPPPGETLWEQSRFVANDGGLRGFVLNEPRGGVFRHVNLLVPPKRPEAHMGFIIMEPEDTPPMSGSNSLCVATVLLETGILPMQEPETRLVLEAPGGLIEATASCRDGRVERVRVTNVPSFVDRLGAVLEVEGLDTLAVDTAYGGDSFAIVDARALGFALTPDEARDIAVTGVRITRAANEQLGFTHPANPEWSHVSFCQMAAPVEVARRREDGPERGRDPARQDRPIALRHGMLGAARGAARTGRARHRRAVRRALAHRLAVRLPHRGPGAGGRSGSGGAVVERPGVDHGHAPAHARSRRSVARGLSAERHLAANGLNRTQGPHPARAIATRETRRSPRLRQFEMR